MSNSTRYFQLTPDILVEYNYSSLNTGTISIGHDKGKIIARTLTWDDSGFVLPVNKSESKFIAAGFPISKSGFTPESISEGICNVFADTFKLQFTSRNYFGNNGYDGFIITVNIYDKIKNKICLFSHYVRKTDDISINENPLLINQKLYTANLSFKIPNVYAILYPEKVVNSNDENLLRSKLFPTYGILDNTPIIMSIYGVKSTVVEHTHEYYTVEKINSIYIPVEDHTKKLNFTIYEDKKYDYFVIKTDKDSGSLSSYLNTISDGHPELYIVFHELTVTENVVDSNNDPHSEITHHEQFLINGGKQTEDGIIVNGSELDKEIYFRPVIRYADKDVSVNIDVKTYIINTLDNTTIVKHISLDSRDPESRFDPNKYGKKINQIVLDGSENNKKLTQVKVYNKRPDIDLDGVKITNASSNVKIENHQHSVIGFIECANVGVSIEQIPTELLQ